MDYLIFLLIFIPAFIAAVSSLQNGKKISSIDKTLLQMMVAYALIKKREKSHGENFGKSESR
jgi:hypothetical protein